MPIKFCDHGLYPAYNNIPTFGTCQEGDGLAAGAAVVATVSIDLSAYSASNGNTFTIAGAVLTCVGAGAGANQFNIASGSTLAQNIAAAINQTTNTVTVSTVGASNPLLGWPTNMKLQDVFFATNTGATLNIQTRAGSALFNTTSFVAAVSSGFTGGATINAQFSGGASGAWGYLFNHNATIWKSALAVASYGLWATNKPYAGTIDAGDVIKVRANKTLTLSANTNITWTMSAMGTAAAPVIFEIDDGTTWPADGSTPVLKISQSHTGNTSMFWSGISTTWAYIKGKQYLDGQRNMVLETPANTGTTFANIRIVGGAPPIRFESIDLNCLGNSTNSTNTCQVSMISGPVAAQGVTTFVNCRFGWPTQNGGANAGYINANSFNGIARLKMIGCVFSQTDATIAQNPVMTLISGGSYSRFEFDECKFTGILGNSRLMPSNALIEGGTITFRNCDFGAIKHRGPNVALVASARSSMDAIWASTKHGNRDFFFDHRSGFVEWNSAKGYPTLSAKLLDGTTGWVIFASPTTVAANISRMSPLEVPAVNKYNTLATGARTVTLNIALESTLSWTLADISLQVSYVDSTGSSRTVDSFSPAGGALTADPSSTWSSESGGQVTFNGQTFNKYKFSVSCPDMANGCEITATPRLHTSVANETLGVFINPDLVVV